MDVNDQERLAQLRAQVNHFYSTGQITEALADALEVYSIVHRLDPNGLELAQSALMLARLYQALGDIKSADEYYRSAIDRYRDLFGQDHETVASVIHAQAELHENAGDFAAAIQLYKDATSIQRKVGKANDPKLMRMLNNLALSQLHSGDIVEAQHSLSDALHIAHTQFADDSLEMARLLSTQADVLFAQQGYVQADESLTRALMLRQTTLDADHPLVQFTQEKLTAQRLDTIAILLKLIDETGTLMAVGEFEAALSETTKAYKMARHFLGDIDTHTVDLLGLLADLQYKASDYHTARTSLQTLLENQRVTPNISDLEIANTLMKLGVVEAKLGNGEKGEYFLLEARDKLRVAKGVVYRDIKVLLFNLAEIQDQLIHIEARAATLEELAWLAHSIGDYDQAANVFEVLYSYKCDNKLCDPESLEATRIQSWLANTYQQLVDYRRAIPLQEQVVEVRERICGKASTDYATSVHNLAAMYTDIHDYEKAEERYKEALTIRRQILGDNHQDTAESFDGLGVIMFYTGRDVEAVFHIGFAVHVFRSLYPQGHPNLVRSLQNMAIIYLKGRQFVEAEKHAEEAIETSRKVFPPDHPQLAKSLAGLAFIYQMRGKYSLALSNHQESLRIRRVTFGDFHPDIEESLINLALLYTALDRREDALTALLEAIHISETLIVRVFTMASNRQRESYLQMQGYVSYSLLLSLLQDFQRTKPELAIITYKVVLRRKALLAEAIVAERRLVFERRHPELAPQLAMLTRLGTQIAAKQLAGPGKEAREEYLQILSEWSAEYDRLEAELVRHIPEMELEKQLQDADPGMITVRLPSESALVEFIRYDIVNPHASFERKETFITGARYAAFVLRSNEPEQVHIVNLGDAEPIEQLIATFRKMISGDTENEMHHSKEAYTIATTNLSHHTDRSNLRGVLSVITRDARPSNSSMPNLVKIGTALRQTLLDPLQTSLAGCRRLFVAPDGDLNRLPLEVLPLDNKRSVVNTYKISYLTVGRDLLRFGSVSRRQSSASLVVADPNFDLGGESTQQFRNGDPFQRLMGARQEGKHVATLLGVPPLFDNDAVEHKIKTHESPYILHIATHGFVLPDPKRDSNEVFLERYFRDAQPGAPLDRLSSLENPLLRSGLALAGANTSLQGYDQALAEVAEDGILTAVDVSNLDLWDTELVVLSACHTGLGSVRVGEGVFGLRRAFVLAGAKTLVMSLWKVPDTQTKELMEMFYRKLLEGAPRAEALRCAQLAIRKHHPNPFFWGAFICQGNPDPLSIQMVIEKT